MVIHGLWDKIRGGVAKLFGREGIAPQPPVLEDYDNPPPPVLEDMPLAVPGLEDSESTPPQLEDQPINWGDMDEPVPGDPPTMEELPTGQPTLEDLPTQEPTQDEIDHATDGLTAEDMEVPEPRADLLASQTQSIRAGEGVTSRTVGDHVVLSGPVEEEGFSGLIQGAESTDPFLLLSGIELGEGDEEGNNVDIDTPQVDTWDRDDPPEDTTGITITFHRDSFDHSLDDPILHGQAREAIFDSGGHLVSIGAEAEYNLDEVEDCDIDIDGGTYSGGAWT